MNTRKFVIPTISIETPRNFAQYLLETFWTMMAGALAATLGS